MEDWKRSLQGSESCDVFKRKHKEECPGSYYATDGDLILIAKFPPGVVAYIDFKKPEDSVTFTEALFYNLCTSVAPVYIVTSGEPNEGPFEIERYLGGDWKPDPPIVDLEYVTTATDWPEYKEWEGELRDEYKKREGWGKLKTSEEF